MNGPQNNLGGENVQLQSPGIVVLSPSLRVLHINHQAVSLTDMLRSVAPNEQVLSHSTSGLPSILAQMAGEILRILRSRRDTSDQGEFEMRHEIHQSAHAIDIRGVGVPNAQGVQHARIVFILTETAANRPENDQVPMGLS